MIILFTGCPGSGKTTVLCVLLRYLLDNTSLRVCTVDLDYRTGKLTRILTPHVEVLCDLYDIAVGECSETTHVVLSDRHIHVPVKVEKRRQEPTILDLLEELHTLLEVDMILVDSIEPHIAALANRKIFKVIHVVRPDVVEYYDYASNDDIIVVNNLAPRFESRIAQKIKNRNVLYMYFDPLVKICLDIPQLPPTLSRETQKFCTRLYRSLKGE